MTENEFAHEIVDAAFTVHKALGLGLLEAAYEGAFGFELQKRDLKVESHVPITIMYEELTLENAFIADLIIEDSVIVELKSVEKIAPVHSKQLLTYLRLTGKRLGLLVNFGESYIRDGITRVANGLDRS